MKKYDVFISSKSEDYGLAEQVYVFLVNNGLKVFLSSRELDQLGEADYSKAIDEAIDNTKHMIVVSSNLSYIKEKWVKHEWSTFCDDLKGGYRDGNIITILSEAIQLKDLPASIRHKQSFTFNNYKQHILHYLRQDEDNVKDINMPKEDTSLFDIVLKSPGTNKLNVIKLVKDLTGIGLKEAKHLVDKAPSTIKKGLAKVEADRMKKQLEIGGAKVELKYNSLPNRKVEEQSTLEKAINFFNKGLFTNAFSLFRSAAIQGLASAQWYLGDCYYNGYGVNKDEAKAVMWFRRSAEQGFAPAKDKLLNIHILQSTNQSFKVNGVTFTMVKVEGGTFMMGATCEQGNDANDSEKPAHKVTVSSFFIGQTEATQELWEAVMGNNPSHFKGAKRPVDRVSWNDCQVFIRKLNQITGKNFRLPTEAEWEFAARGGNRSQGYKYSGSNNLEEVAWYNNKEIARPADADKAHDVATKRANELGIYDMSGNVMEWCNDFFGDYNSSSQINPQGPKTGSFHVLRGGSWFSRSIDCRVSSRRDSLWGYSFLHGLRLAL